MTESERKRRLQRINETEAKAYVKQSSGVSGFSEEESLRRLAKINQVEEKARKTAERNAASQRRQTNIDSRSLEARRIKDTYYQNGYTTPQKSRGNIDSRSEEAQRIRDNYYGKGVTTPEAQEYVTGIRYNKLGKTDFELLDSIVNAQNEEDIATTEYLVQALRGIDEDDAQYRVPSSSYISKSTEAKKKLKELGYSDDEIVKLVRYHQAKKNADIAEKNSEDFRQMAEEHPLFASGISVVSNLASPTGLIELARAKVTDTPIDPNSSWYGASQMTSDIRGEVQENYDWNIDLNKDGKSWDAFDFVYGAGMSTLDSVVAGKLMPGLGITTQSTNWAVKALARTANSMLGGSLIGSQAMTSTIQDVTRRGGTTEQALNAGIVSFLAETLSEAWSLGNLKGLQESGKHGLKNIAKDLLKNSGVNASEEAVTEAVNIVYDRYALGDKSIFEHNIRTYMQQQKSDGTYYTREEAENLAKKDSLKQIGEAALSGAFQGLTMGGPASIQNQVKQHNNLANTGTLAKAAEQTGAIIKEGQAAPEKSKAHKLAESIVKAQGKGKEISDYKLGLLQYENSRQGKVAEGTFAGVDSKADLEKAFDEKLLQLTAEKKKSDNKVRQLYNDMQHQKAKDSLYEEYKAAKKQLEKSGGREGMQEAFEETLKEDVKRRAEAEKLRPEIQTADGTQSKLDGSGIFKNSEGVNTVKTEDGKEIKVSELVFKDENTKKLYDATEGMTAEKANLFVSEYNGETVAEYKAAANYFYRLGSTGMTAEKIRESFAPEWSEVLSEESQAKFADLGAAERPETAGLTDLTTSKKSETEQMQFDIISEIGKQSGLEFIIVDDWKNTNGAFFQGTNRIVLSRNAEYGLLTRTAGHEAYHYVEQYASEKAEELKTFVLQALTDKGNNIDSLLEAYDKNRYTTREAQIAELVADSMFDVFSDRKTVQKLAKENMTLTQKIRTVLDRTLSCIEKGLKALSLSGKAEEVKALIDEKDKLAHIRELMTEGLEQAKKNRAEQTEGQKNNTAEAVDKSTKKNEFSYEELVKKQDMKITSLGHLNAKDLETYQQNHTLFCKEAIKKARQKNNARNSDTQTWLHCNDIGKDILISMDSFRHSGHRITPSYADICMSIGDILENAVAINEMTESSHADKATILLGVAQDEENLYFVRMLVDNRRWKLQEYDILYAITKRGIKKEDVGIPAPEFQNESVSRTPSFISISDLLDYVKNVDLISTVVSKDVAETLEIERPNDPKISPSLVYSTKKDMPLEAVFGFYSDVVRENKAWSLLNNMLEIQTNSARKGIHLRRKDIETVAKKLIKDNSSTMTVEELTERLEVIYDYRAVRGKLSGGDKLSDSELNNFKALAAETARAILEKSESKDSTLWEQYSEVREFLKNTPIFITENVLKEINNQFGSFKDFRNLLFGKVNRISTKNTEARSLDEVWQELSELAPEYFSKDINELDMPGQLLYFFDAISPKMTSNADLMNIEEQSVLLTDEIVEGFNSVLQLATNDAKTKDILRDYENELKKAKAEQKKEVKEESRKEYDQKLEDYRAKREDTERRRVTRNKIERTFNYLARRYEKGNDNDSVPERLRPLVGAVIDGLPHKGMAVDANKIDSLIVELSKIDLKEREGEESVITELINKVAALKLNLETNNKIFVKDAQGSTIKKAVSIDSMTNAELSLLLDVLNVVKHTVKTEQKLFSDNLKASRDAYSMAIIDELSDKPDKKSEFLESTVLGLLKPHNLFKRFGSETLVKFFENLREGENIAANIQYDARIREQEIKKSTGYDPKWKHETKSLEFRSGKVNLTIEQIMAIYATSKREQGRAHLLGGGIKIYTTKDMKQAAKAIRKSEKDKGKKDLQLPEIQTVYLDETDIGKVERILSPSQKEYADTMVEYITKVIGEKRNDVSMRLYGIKKYKEKYYYPIMTDKAFLPANLGKQETESKIQYQSAAKNTVKGAENAVIISDFTETVNHHIYESSLYCGYVIPIADFNKVFNFTDKIPVGEGIESLIYRDISVQNELRRVGGKNAVDEIKNFLVAVDSGSRTDNIIPGQARLMSKVKKSAVMGNLSVVIQQPTALYRAMLYVDPKYFGVSTWFGPLSSMTWANKKEIEEMRRFNGCALVKEIGYFDVNMGRTATDYIGEYKVDKAQYKDWNITDKLNYLKDNGMERLDSFMGWAASKADEKTWGAIWKACKKQTKAENSELSGDALCEAAAELFQKTIAETQVYDSVFTKCPWMRKKEGLAMMMMQFMSEPITSLNMYYQAIQEVKKTKKGTDERKNANKMAARAFGGCILSTVYCAVAKGIVQSMRDDDEDESFLEKWVANIITNSILDPIGMLPMIKDIVSALQGYDLERTDAAVFGTVAETIEVLMNDNKGIDEKIFSIFKALSQTTGIPFMNIARDVKGFINLAITGYKAATIGKQPTTAKGVGNIMKENFAWLPLIESSSDYEQLYSSIIDKDTRHYDKVYNNLIADGKEKSTIESGIAKVLAEKNGTLGAAYTLTAEGKLTDAANKINELKAAGFSDNVINKALNTFETNRVNELLEDKRTEQAAKARYNRNYEEYEQIISELVDEGNKESIVIKAIEKNKLELETRAADYSFDSEDTYDSYDLRNAIIANDDAATERIYKLFVEQSGEEDARSKMKTQIVNACKDKFISETKAESLLKEYVYNEEIKEGTRKERREAEEKRENDIFWDMEKIRTGGEKYDALRSAIDNGTVSSGVVERYTDNGVTEGNLKSWLTNNYKEKLLGLEKGTAEYNELYDSLIDVLTDAGLSEGKAKKTIKEWYKD